MPDPSGRSSTGARVARLCPPGKWWFLAVCEDCKWCGMSWKDKGWADEEATAHNARSHTSAAASEWIACCPHCGCPPGKRQGHDDTCRYGCNDAADASRSET